MIGLRAEPYGRGHAEDDHDAEALPHRPEGFPAQRPCDGVFVHQHARQLCARDRSAWCMHALNGWCTHMT